MKTLILSSYFSRKVHPNDPGDSAVVGRDSDGRVFRNSYDYIKVWYESVVDLGINAVLFYDELSEEFIDSLSTDKVSFKKVEVNNYSNNDFRFFCFYDYLNELSEKPEVVFHNDASDVKVVKDPYSLVYSMDDIDYFCCKDSLKINEFPYLKFHEHAGWEDSFLFKLNYDKWDLINMGVVGGKYEKMIKFYKEFIDVRESTGMPDFNADMWLLQYLIRSRLQPCEFLMGEPVCSEFKSYQNEREDVYFIHK